MTTPGRKTLLLRCLCLQRVFLQRCVDYSLVESNDAARVTAADIDDLNSGEQSIKVQALSREARIKQYKSLQIIQRKVDFLLQSSDEETQRRGLTLKIQSSIQQSLQDIEKLRTEIALLTYAENSEGPTDELSRPQEGQDNRWRLDMPEGPLVAKSGSVLRPFVFTSDKQQIRSTIFRPDHSLPTMSIEQYLQNEVLSGGLPTPGAAKTVNSSSEASATNEDLERAEDNQRLQAIAWDTYTEHNVRGQGNTMNRG